MNKARDAIPNLPLGLTGMDSMHDTGIIAANPGAGVCVAVVDVLPVGGVEADGVDLGEDPTLARLGDGNVADGDGVELGVDDDGLLGRHLALLFGCCCCMCFFE